MTGDAFLASIMNLQGDAREAAIAAALHAGNVPPYLFAFVPVAVSATIDGADRELLYFVSPDYLEIGETPEDARRIPATPWTYQAYFDTKNVVLPTRRMVGAIWKTALAKVQPHPFSAAELDAHGREVNQSTARYLQSDDAIRADLAKNPHYAPSVLVGGAKKDVVVGPNLDGSHVAIFGWHYANGNGNDDKANRVQPYPGPHESGYADYSHGARMVSRNALLDGQWVDLSRDVAEDPKLSILVSDQGPLPLHFPSTGPGKVRFVSPPATPPTTPGTPKGPVGGAGAGSRSREGTGVGGAIAFAFGMLGVGALWKALS